MSRAFKTRFHGGNPELKTIVTMSVTVNNGKLFKQMDKRTRSALVISLNKFIEDVRAFKNEVKFQP